MPTKIDRLLLTPCTVIISAVQLCMLHCRWQASVAAFATLLALLSAPTCAGVHARLPIDIVVGLPLNEGSVLRNPFRLTIAKSQPVFDVAVEDIYSAYRLLPSGSLRITYVDTNLSDAIGPQRIIERYCARSMDAVMGMSYVYALAPVARMSQFWEKGVPVFTTSAMVDELGDKEQFPLLTRLMGTYKTVAQLMLRLVSKLRWRTFHFFFHDEAARRNVLGRSECFFSLNAIKNVFNHERNIVWTVEMFSETVTTLEKYREMLKKASMQTNSKCRSRKLIFLKALHLQLIMKIKWGKRERGSMLPACIISNCKNCSKTY